jgi:hypothetical protein
VPDPNLRSDQSFRSKSIMQVEQVGKFSNLECIGHLDRIPEKNNKKQKNEEPTGGKEC